MFRILELFFFIYLGYIVLKNISALFSGTSNKSNGPHDYNRGEFTGRREGEINIEKVPEKDKPIQHHQDANDSEYIDFKEIKD